MNKLEAKEKAIQNIYDAFIFLDLISVKHNLKNDENAKELRNILKRIYDYAEIM